MEVQVGNNEIAVIDDLGNTVGLLVSNLQSSPPHARNVGINVRYPIPCSKQATITTDWLKENFVENVLTSVPRSVMFEEYVTYCYSKNIKPFNQAVFGKVVRACFPNLATRRLGVRGHSRYHYAGLSVKLSSIYAEKLRYATKRLTLTRTNPQSQFRRRDVGAHVTIDGTSNQSNQSSCAHGNKSANNKPTGTIALVLPPYPSEDDILIKAEWTRFQMASFLDFYRSYNRRLLGYIISMDFEKTSNHIRSFAKYLPEDCRAMLQTSSVCDIIAICDDIMFQEATAALLPDCLATLTSEFNVSVRKFAKTLPMWIGENSNPVFTINEKVIESRIASAKHWSDHVRRVTTLCHVAKEARKTLTFPAIVVQLLADLKNISIKDIADQCAFAAGGPLDATQALHERKQAEYYMSRFCQLLQQQANVEAYAQELETLVNTHAGLEIEHIETEEALNNTNFESVTDRTRLFMMKWSMYGSKILTEITLKSSESVGTFHLIMLLFGDYINHLISMKNERKRRLERLRTVIKQGSSYFKRLWVSSSNQGLSGNIIKQPVFMVSPKILPFAFLTSSIRSQLADSTNQPLRHVEVAGTEPDNLRDHMKGGSDFEATLRPSVARFATQSIGEKCMRNLNLETSGKEESAMVVESMVGNKIPSSFYLVPGKSSQPNSAMLIRK